MNITIETANIAIIPASIIALVKSCPNKGEIVSSSTICSWNGRLPVSRIVCNFFICAIAELYASVWVAPAPYP